VKLLHSNGRTLEVRDVGPPLYRLRAGAAPLKHNGWSVVEDSEARAILRAYLAEGAVRDDVGPVHAIP
jgi:hypothetical protein